jgi:hypothetical protein
LAFLTLCLLSVTLSLSVCHDEFIVRHFCSQYYLLSYLSIKIPAINVKWNCNLSGWADIFFVLFLLLPLGFSLRVLLNYGTKFHSWRCMVLIWLVLNDSFQRELPNGWEDKGK